MIGGGRQPPPEQERDHAADHERDRNEQRDREKR